MFAKAWYFLTQQFRPQYPTVQQIPFPRDTQLFDSPSLRHKMPKLTFSLQDAQVNGQPSGDFKLTIEGDEEFKKGMRNGGEELEVSQAIIDDVRDLTEKMRQMSVQEWNMNEAQKKTNVYDPEKHMKAGRLRSTDRQNIDLKRDYETQITQFRLCKYSKEQEDYPLITFQNFKRTQLIWRDKKRNTMQIKKTRLECVEKLTYKAMGGIDHGEWLNDDVINMYIQLMEKTFAKDSQFKLLNSFFATTTLNKKENMIERYLKKKGIDRSYVLLMPVNDRNHWYFAKFTPTNITVYDSLKKPAEVYLDNPIFKNALKFGKSLYGEELALEVCQSYPQQNNGFDCGVFMLMGIRDSLRQREWSFRQGDMRFKRIQLACEVYNQELMLPRD